MPKDRLDRAGGLRHSPAMRWLFLINLLAVVLLSGAVAIVIEGTPLDAFGTVKPMPAQNADDSPDAEPSIPVTSPGGEGPATAEVLQVEAATPIVEGDTSSIPLPRRPRRAAVATGAPVVAPPILLGQLRIATEGAFAPFNFEDEKGQPAGFDIDVAWELCARLGRACIFEVRSWSALQAALIGGEVDILVSSIQIPSTAAEGIRFSDPYYGSHGRFVGPIDAATGSAFPSSATQIAVQRDTVHAAYLAQTYPSIERVLTQTFEAALAMVEAGEVEGAFGDNATALRWLKAKACCLAVGKAVSAPIFFGEGIGIAVRADDDALLTAINLALAQMVSDGTHERLSRRYFAGSIY